MKKKPSTIFEHLLAFCKKGMMAWVHIAKSTYKEIASFKLKKPPVKMNVNTWKEEIEKRNTDIGQITFYEAYKTEFDAKDNVIGNKIVTQAFIRANENGAKTRTDLGKCTQYALKGQDFKEYGYCTFEN